MRSKKTEQKEKGKKSENTKDKRWKSRRKQNSMG